MDIQSETANDTFENNSSCISVSDQYLQISLPVELDAYAQLGGARIICYGDPVISMQKASENNCGYEYEFVITQEISIKLPVKYCTNVKSGDVQVECS